MAKKKITIDDLAVMTQKGFVELDSKMTVGFKAVGERFDKVETRLTSIESDIKALKEQIRILVGHIDARFFSSASPQA